MCEPQLIFRISTATQRRNCYCLCLLCTRTGKPPDVAGYKKARHKKNPLLLLLRWGKKLIFIAELSSFFHPAAAAAAFDLLPFSSFPLLLGDWAVWFWAGRPATAHFLGAGKRQWGANGLKGIKNRGSLATNLSFSKKLTALTWFPLKNINFFNFFHLPGTFPRTLSTACTLPCSPP